MKKKMVTILLAGVLALSVVGCGAAPVPETGNTVTEEADGVDVNVGNTEIDDSTVMEDNNAVVEDTDEIVIDEGEAVDPNGSETTVGTETSGTMGTALLNDFIAQLEADSSLSSMDIATALTESPNFVYAGATMEVEPGYLMGFTEEISGFDDGVMFAPMIGSVPFVGYVFTVSNDPEGFLATLNSCNDPRWNICTEADETVSTIYGDKVCFIMCSNEE